MHRFVYIWSGQFHFVEGRRPEGEGIGASAGQEFASPIQ